MVTNKDGCPIFAHIKNHSIHWDTNEICVTVQVTSEMNSTGKIGQDIVSTMRLVHEVIGDYLACCPEE